MASQIQCVSVEFRCRTRGGLKRFNPADFQVFPAAFPSEANNPISYQFDRFRIKNERLECIAEGEADAAAASERTAQFHNRYQRCQAAAPEKRKVERGVVVGLMKHVCPGTGV